MTDAPRTPYPDYEVLAKWNGPSWNERTREVVRERLDAVPPRRFLSEAQWALLEALCARLMPQPGRPAPIPIAPWIDRQLFEDQGEGYRGETVPRMREAWPRGLDAIDAEARARHGRGFVALSPEEQDALLKRIQQDDVATDAWDGMPARHFFQDMLLKTVAGLYYTHPEAWSEIGFGGPASPRGYVRMGLDERDPWEAKLSHDV